MERSVAVKKLARLLGKGFGYQVNLKAPIAEEKAEAKVKCEIAVKRRDELDKKAMDLKMALLNGNAEYVALRDAQRAAAKEVQELRGALYSYRFTAGVANGMFFHTRAQGDSWEEVIEQIEKKKTN